MEDNAMPHRSRSATAYLQSEAVTSVPWPAMSPNLNPIEHTWDILGRRIQVREPPVQNFRQLKAALHRAWIQLRAHGWPRNRSHGFALAVGSC
jgi:transposase